MKELTLGINKFKSGSEYLLKSLCHEDEFKNDFKAGDEFIYMHGNCFRDKEGHEVFFLTGAEFYVPTI